MKRFFLLLLFISFSFGSYAQNSYFVASNGNDANNGLSEAAPFRSLKKINSVTLQPGDKILLHKGDVFHGELTVKQSGTQSAPIVIDSYGAGKKPVIDCSYSLTDWKPFKGNIWQAQCPPECGDTLTNVFMNGEMLPLGRYPNLDARNKGFLTIASHTGKNILVSGVNLGADWTGAEVVYYPQQWVLERCKILSQDHNNLTLDGNTAYEIQDNWGFFIQNSIGTLDEDGEWFYDKDNKHVYVYYSQGNPNSNYFTATQYNNGIAINNSNFITVKDITIVSAKRNGFFAHNSSNLAIINLDILYSGENGITISGSGSNLDIEDNTINHINDNGVDIQGYSNLTFRKNSVKNIATIIGRGRGKDGHYFGMFYVNPYNDGSSIIENNVFDSVGYCGIRFQSSNIYIQHNYFNHSGLVKGDGAAIYTFNYTNQKAKPYSNEHIIENIITNSYFSAEGVYFKNGNESDAHGIYMDLASQNVEIKGNTVINCASSGIYILAANNISVTGNTCYSNGAALYILDKQAIPVHGIDVQGNIFYAKSQDQVVGRFSILNDNDLSNFGTFDNNYYSDFSSGKGAFAIKNSNQRYKMSLNDWKGKFNNDKDTRDVLREENDSNTQIFFNASETPKVIQLNGQYRDVHNNPYNGSITLAPYTSILLTNSH